jgi:hypothetical protein
MSECPLTPVEQRIVDAFAQALRQVREEEMRRARLTVYKLQLIRDGLAEVNADLRAGRLS